MTEDFIGKNFLLLLAYLLNLITTQIIGFKIGGTVPVLYSKNIVPRYSVIPAEQFLGA